VRRAAPEDVTIMTSEVAEREDGERKKTGPFQFLREVRAEGRKVTWATRNEVIVSTVMVLILSIAAAIFFFIVDWIVGGAIRWILNLSFG
jgi:preprotein translocase subunit SecE